MVYACMPQYVIIIRRKFLDSPLLLISLRLILLQFSTGPRCRFVGCEYITMHHQNLIEKRTAPPYIVVVVVIVVVELHGDGYTRGELDEQLFW